MFIVEVSPIKARRGLDTLTYFTPLDTPVGTLIEAPIRGASVLSLVVSCKPAHAIRSQVRTARFTTKKLTSPTYREVFLPACVAAAAKTAAYHVTSVGSVLRECMPAALLSATTITSGTRAATARTRVYDPTALQAPCTERAQAYKTHIRETLAGGGSIFILAPTAYEATRLADVLSTGIAGNTILLTRSTSPKKQKEHWHDALTRTTPVVIIATASFIGIPRQDISLLIIERERARNYKRMRRPFIDMRTFAIELARASKWRLLITDSFLSLDTHRAIAEGTINADGQVTHRIAHASRMDIVDMHKDFAARKETRAHARYPALASTVEKALTDENAHTTFVLAARRGIAPTTLCNDCGAIVHCARCEANVVLHEYNGERYFLCHRCGERASAHMRCTTCDSWKLVPLGTGIEHIESHIRATFPHLPCHCIDQDTNNTAAAIEKTLDAWRTDGGVLLGTELVLPYLDRPYDIGVFAAFDSLYSIPDFRIDERIFGMLTRIREYATRTVYVQTRHPDHPVLTHAASGGAASFVRDELNLREQLHYPPFTVIIKVTTVGARLDVMRDMQKFAILFARHKPRIFADLIPVGKNQYSLHALLRVRADAWPTPTLVHLLADLPAQFTVEVNPSR